MAEAAPQGPGTPASPPGQSPPGSSPATTPVPNRGQEASGLATLSVIVAALLNLAPKLGASTDVGQAVLDAVKKLGKYVPPGSTSKGIENNAMMQMQREHQQNQPMAAMMAARGQPGGEAQGAQTPQAAA